MNKTNKTLLAVVLMIVVASAAMVSVYISEDRDLEVLPWLTYELNYGASEIYGWTDVTDYINVTSTRNNIIYAEIHTELLFNGVVLEDTEGISIHHFVTGLNGDIRPAVDSNLNGIPDVTIWGDNDVTDGFTVIERRIVTFTDLDPGTYTLKTQIVPRED